MGTHTYITGLRFISRSKSDQSVGYVSESKEEVMSNGPLLGFGVAIIYMGFRAIQYLGQNNYCSAWIGHVTDTPVSNRLVKSGPINKLKVFYDVSLRHNK